MAKMMLTRAPNIDHWERARGHPMLRAPLLAHDSPDWREAAEQKKLLLLPTSELSHGERRHNNAMKQH